VRLRPDAGTRARVEALIEAESSCCGFLEMGVADEGGALALTIAAPPHADPEVVPQMLAAFARDR
jgi:hypothetical protein